jgi:hypothetical protein
MLSCYHLSRRLVLSLQNSAYNFIVFLMIRPIVPVELLDNGSTTIPSTDLALPDNYGCSINGKFFAEGAQVPSNANKPCELCYCIRNMTACVMQECTLHIDGCQPIYNKGVCCPVRYSCGKLKIILLLFKFPYHIFLLKQTMKVNPCQ